jgi:hypothetical protein
VAVDAAPLAGDDFPEAGREGDFDVLVAFVDGAVQESRCQGCDEGLGGERRARTGVVHVEGVEEGGPDLEGL